jgi:hypothetical protein
VESEKAKRLNSVYSLGKYKKSNEFVVGNWVNQDLWSVDGKCQLICSFKEMSRWRYFTESQEYISEVELKQGDRVLVENESGHDVWFYVIFELSREDNTFKYLVAI